jgi:hypothetical protein
VFAALGGDWRHYAGEAENRTAEPFDAGHPPVIGWLPAKGRAAIAARLPQPLNPGPLTGAPPDHPRAGGAPHPGARMCAPFTCPGARSAALRMQSPPIRGPPSSAPCRRAGQEGASGGRPCRGSAVPRRALGASTSDGSGRQADGCGNERAIGRWMPQPSPRRRPCGPAT